MEKKQLWRTLTAAGTTTLLVGLGCYYLGTQAALPKADQPVKSAFTQVKTEAAQKAHLDDDDIPAEQIVVKITADGYVTSHGDHYHYYNGKVPFDAIWSEELLFDDPNYTLKKADVVSDIQGGHVILHDGHYYIYLTDKKKASNMRTRAELAEQKKISGHHVAKAGKKKEDVKKSAEAAGKAKKHGAYTTDDGYVFHASDIIEDTGDGYIVPHGDHFHFIPKADLSAGELAAAKQFLAGKGKGSSSMKKRQPHASQVQAAKPSHPHSSVPASSAENNQQVGSGKKKTPQRPAESTAHHQSKTWQQLVAEVHALPKSQRYQEADGLLFEPSQVTKKTRFGYVIPHGDHFHVILPSKLSALEVAATEAYLKAKNTGIAAKPTQPSPEPEVKKPEKPKPEPETEKPEPKPHTKPSPKPEATPSENNHKPETGAEQSQPEAEKPSHSEEAPDLSKETFKTLPADCLPLKEFIDKRTGADRRNTEQLLYVDKEVSPGRFRIPHYDHYHYISDIFLLDLFNDDEEKAARAVNTMRFLIAHPEYRPASQNGWGEFHEPTEEKPAGEEAGQKPASQRHFQGRLIQAFGKGLDGKPYTTSDGYTFSKESILGMDGDQVIASHGDHQHLIPLGELEQSELDQVAAWLNEQGNSSREKDKEAGKEQEVQKNRLNSSPVSEEGRGEAPTYSEDKAGKLTEEAKKIVEESQDIENKSLDHDFFTSDK